VTLFGSSAVFWFVVGFVFLILEMATPGIVFVFFGLGAWLVLVLILIFPLFSPVFQFLVFIVSSFIFLFALRRHLKALFYKDKDRKKVDSLSERMVANNYLEREVDVVEDITPGHPGKIELNGTNWTAKSAEPLTVGQRAKVVDIADLVVTVEKI
jgi:membrane protein implicated in regulation of membrane protease activity